MKPAVLVLLVLAFCTSPVNAVTLTHSVPPESFLDYHVDTAAQLTFEVTYDPAVCTRLARHFHLTRTQMRDYVARDLVLSHLTKPLRTRDYCLPRSGHEYYVTMTLPKGTPVFAERGTDKPILRLVCGNPLVAALPPAPHRVAAPKRVVKTRTAGAHLARTAPPPPASPAMTQATLTPAVPTVSGSFTGIGAGEVVFTDGGGSGWLGSVSGWSSMIGGLLALVSQTGNGSDPASAGHQIAGILPNRQPTPIPAVDLPLTPQPTPEPNPGLIFALGSMMLGAAAILRSQGQRRLRIR